MMKIYNSITKLTYLDKKLENGNGTIGRLRTDTDHDSKAILLPKGGILADELSTRQSSGGTIESSEFSRERTTEGTPGPVTGECKTVSTTDPINCEHLQKKPNQNRFVTNIAKRCYVCKRHWGWWRFEKCTECSKFMHSKCTCDKRTKFDSAIVTDLLSTGVLPPCVPFTPDVEKIEILYMCIELQIDTHLTFVSQWIHVTFKIVQHSKIIPLRIEAEKPVQSPPSTKTMQKILHTNVRRTIFDRRDVQYYFNQVKRFTNDTTQTTTQHINKIKKYWIMRHILFDRFDMGILLDHESFYSVCPEVLARHIADRCKCESIIDPFCGAGGNVIQFTRTCRKVIAADLDATKISLARKNSTIYRCRDKIEFKVQDYFTTVGQRADIVFMSPPWGGPEYLAREVYALSSMCEANGGGENIVRIAKSIAPKLALHLPRTIDKKECVVIAGKIGFRRLTFEENFINSKHNSTTVFFS